MELEARFMLTATLMFNIRTALLETLGVLSQNLRVWIDQWTDPFLSKLAPRDPNEIADIMNAVIAEGTLVLNSAQTEKRGDVGRLIFCCCPVLTLGP